ncbi:hypothetical protein [Agarilytica rhodophyticola]|uniref:hypothetical protein n=1 Tax=Agarilytica rhodophyticola TaxID=1737490 RepID=UPI000B346E6E|nr:hypothetical protein [Agarilytica rhodophyticola]
MLTNRLLTTAFCIAFIATLQAPSALACQYHDGFGSSPWSNFGSGMRHMPQYYASARQVSEQPKIKLSLPSMIRAKVSEEETLTVSYTSEWEDPEVQLTLDISPGIEVESNKINLAGKNGEHTFVLKPQASGTYRLKVTARNLNNKDTPSLHETVYVNIYE